MDEYNPQTPATQTPAMGETAAEPATGAAPGTGAESSLTDELRELGALLASAIKAAASTPEAVARNVLAGIRTSFPETLRARMADSRALPPLLSARA